MKKSAIISECKKYRYEIRRIWDESKPWVLFICLNPSTADGQKDDQTLRRCISYARRWGYGGVVIANLFAYRATDSSELYTVDDPVGPDNDYYLKSLTTQTAEIVCAWGNEGGYKNRDSEVLQLLTEPKCLIKLKSGNPGHPLYLRKDLNPSPLYDIK